MGGLEKWKSIGGFEGCYEVSTMGRVRSLKNRTTKLMKLGNKARGYFRITLYDKNGKTYYKSELSAT